MKFNVTQKDIDKGILSNVSNCPIALAVIRATGVVGYRVLVTGGSITIGGTDYKAPASVNSFVGKFDAYGPVGSKPFSFSLPVKKAKTRAKTGSKKQAKLVKMFMPSEYVTT